MKILPTRNGMRCRCTVSTPCIRVFILLPVLTLVKHMTKTCGKCGHAALDDQALFCNRCGAAVPEEKKPAFPVCPACGTVVSDELALFCNRCGARTHPVPVKCGSCGVPAVDTQSRFCTRCGTVFDQKPVVRNISCPSCGAPDPGGQSIFCNRCGAPFYRQGQSPLSHPESPVVITQKKPSVTLPPVIVPDTDWEPWNDEPPVPGPLVFPAAAAPEQPASADQQIPPAQKRYAHLPLVAEDMRKTAGADVRLPAPDTSVSHKKRPASQKKGVLGFLKK